MRGFRSARRVGVVVLVLAMLPTLMGARSTSEHTPMPTVAGIRAAVVRLADWVTGRTAPKPSVPQQQAGKAPGKQNQVPAAVTRAVARAEGHRPGEGPGQLPAYVAHGAKVKGYVTGAADLGGTDSFSTASSRLVPSGATATSELYRNADGSYTRLENLGAVQGTLTFSAQSGLGVAGRMSRPRRCGCWNRGPGNARRRRR